MPGSDSLANDSGSSSGSQQVMGPSSGTSGMQTRAQSRGRAEGAELRTPLSSGRAVGGASIWTAAAASNSSPSSGGPTEAMVALQQQMVLLLTQNQEQAKRQDALIQLLSSQQQQVAALQGQVQALTVDRSSSRPSATPEVAPVREHVDLGSSSVDIRSVFQSQALPQSIRFMVVGSSSKTMSQKMKKKTRAAAKRKRSTRTGRHVATHGRGIRSTIEKRKLWS